MTDVDGVLTFVGMIVFVVGLVTFCSHREGRMIEAEVLRETRAREAMQRVEYEEETSQQSESDNERFYTDEERGFYVNDRGFIIFADQPAPRYIDEETVPPYTDALDDQE